MLSEPNLSYKPFWGICRPLNSWRANSPNPIQIYCAKFCKAAAKNDINIRAIAGYRTYEYQKGLWDYYASVNGEEYADQYYARPGQSEHNSGLAVDITFNGYNFNEIENYDGYDWILKNMHKYGFILRYPEDKTDVTQYGYESWHIRYVGKEAATKIYKNNWTLEEYHGSK